MPDWMLLILFFVLLYAGIVTVVLGIVISFIEGVAQKHRNAQIDRWP